MSNSIECMDCGTEFPRERAGDKLIRCFDCRRAKGARRSNQLPPGLLDPLPPRLDPEIEIELQAMAERYRAQLDIVEADTDRLRWK